MLDDTGNVYWKNAELGIYIVEALRTWASMSLYWRDRGTFATVASTPFYALQTQFPALLGYTVTDTELVTAIQYQLLEPATGISWTGTDMFTLSDLTLAIQRRRNQFLVDTGAVLTEAQSSIAPTTLGRFPLADTVIDVRRAAFQQIGGSTWNTLWREDEWAMGAFSAMTWPQNPGNPTNYSVFASPPLTLQLFPPPQALGTLDLVTVNAGADLNPISGVPLGIPDDFAWVVKFGALADLLGMDGQARDPSRAAYCEARWAEGIELAKIYTSLVQLQVNDVPVYLCSLQELDAGSYAWQSSSGQPNVGALAGLNLLALAGDGSGGAGVPDGVYGISADLVRKAPVPTADSDLIQIGREELDAILRYAEHLAAF